MTATPPPDPTGWREALAGIEDAEEVRLATRRADGSLRRGNPVWAVVVGGAVYVRSFHGPRGTWFRWALATSRGAIVPADGRPRAVRFESAADPALNTRIDDAYRAKYAASPYAAGMVAADAVTTTLRLVPERE